MQCTRLQRPWQDSTKPWCSQAVPRAGHVLTLSTAIAHRCTTAEELARAGSWWFPPALSAALAMANSGGGLPWQQTPATVVRHGNCCGTPCKGWQDTHCARRPLYVANLQCRLIGHGNCCRTPCKGWQDTHRARRAVQRANLPDHCNLHCRGWAVSGYTCYYV